MKRTVLLHAIPKVPETDRAATVLARAPKAAQPSTNHCEMLGRDFACCPQRKPTLTKLLVRSPIDTGRTDEALRNAAEGDRCLKQSLVVHTRRYGRKDKVRPAE